MGDCDGGSAVLRLFFLFFTPVLDHTRTSSALQTETKDGVICCGVRAYFFFAGTARDSLPSWRA